MARLISSYKDSKYMSKDELVHPVVLTVVRVVDEVMPQDQRIRPVAYFAEAIVDGITIKPLILNVTNLGVLARIANIADLDDWPAKGVCAEFYNDKSVVYQGNVGAVRCRPVPPEVPPNYGGGSTKPYTYEDVGSKPRQHANYASGNDAREGVVYTDADIDVEIARKAVF